MIDDINLDHLVKVGFARFRHSKVTVLSCWSFFFFFFGSKSLKGDKLFKVPPSGRDVSTIIIWNSSVFSLPLIYSVICLYQCGLNGYLFHTLGLNSVLCYLFCCHNCSSFGHWELLQVGSSVPLTCPFLLCFVSFTFCHCKMLQAHLFFLPQF